MAVSRRKYKKSRTKVRVGLPKKNPRLFKPAFSVPSKLLKSIPESEFDPKWDDKGSVIHNYKSFGVLSDPNSLTVTPEIDSPTHHSDSSGSDLEEDDLKSALGKRRRDGKSAPPQPLTAMQRVHVTRLVDKYGDDYQSMFMDIKLNPMQHSVGTLKKLCQRTVFDPVSLTCGHIFCYMCACSAASVSIVDGLKLADPKQKCPLCRERAVYEGAVHLEELNILLGRSCPEYWEQRLQTERVERVKQIKEHWESQCRAFTSAFLVSYICTV